jgi:hypothetical protein
MEEAVVVEFKVLSQYLAGGTQSGQPVPLSIK